jgi:hypothetical protein
MFGYNTIFNLSIIRTYRSAEKVAVGPLLWDGEIYIVDVRFIAELGELVVMRKTFQRFFFLYTDI